MAPRTIVVLLVTTDAGERVARMDLADIVPVRLKSYTMNAYLNAVAAAAAPGPALVRLALDHPLIGDEVREAFSQACRRFNPVFVSLLLGDVGLAVGIADGPLRFDPAAFGAPGSMVSGSFGWGNEGVALH